jgi:hypothetical protein
MSAYTQLLDLVRRQVADASSGDVESAVSLMHARQRVLDTAPQVSPVDAPVIEEVLALDRQLAGFIRERMLRIREDTLTLQRGQTALRGYAALRHAGGNRLNTAG